MDIVYVKAARPKCLAFSDLINTSVTRVFRKTWISHLPINLVLLVLYLITAAVAAVVQSCECYR